MNSTGTAAYLFTGQGAQFPGMGRELADSFPQVRKLFTQADRALGFDLSEACVSADAATLEKTDIQQPAIFLISAAYWSVFCERCGKRFPMGAAAGLSLGEYTALYVAGALDFAPALNLVRQRGRLMQEASRRYAGGMVCVTNVDLPDVERLCQEASGGGILAPANLNCPGQIVVSGEAAACQRLLELAGKQNIRGVALKVSGAFHSALMREAADELRGYLQATEFRTPRAPVYSNVTAEPHGGPDAIREQLYQQMTRPVFWQRCIENLRDAGPGRFVEFGPGKVLTGLLRRIDRTMECMNVSSVADVERMTTESGMDVREVAS